MYLEVRSPKHHECGCLPLSDGGVFLDFVTILCQGEHVVIHRQYSPWARLVPRSTNDCGDKLHRTNVMQYHGIFFSVAKSLGWDRTVSQYW